MHRVADNITLLCSLYKSEAPDRLEQFLSSIQKQDKMPAKIVVVLDGQIPHDLMTILETYKELLPMNILPKKWSGLPDSLNYGLDFIDTGWVARCDTDDLLHSNFITFFSKSIAELDNNVALVSGNVIKNYGSSSFHEERISRYIDKTYFWFRIKNIIYHPAVCFKKDIVLSAGGYPKGRMEDYRLWYKLVALGNKLYISNDVVATLSSFDQAYRRTGLDYFLSELDLFTLKIKTKQIYYLPVDLIVFILRSLLRIKSIRILLQYLRVVMARR